LNLRQAPKRARVATSDAPSRAGEAAGAAVHEMRPSSGCFRTSISAFEVRKRPGTGAVPLYIRT